MVNFSSSRRFEIREEALKLLRETLEAWPKDVEFSTAQLENVALKMTAVCVQGTYSISSSIIFVLRFMTK